LISLFIAGSTVKTSLQDFITALSFKEKVLSVIGLVILVGGIVTGSAAVIIAVIFISLGVWGYVYFSLASRLPLSSVKSSGKKPSPYAASNGEERLPRGTPSEKSPEAPSEGIQETSFSQFFDMESEEYPPSLEPRTEFDFLLGKVLAAVKEALIAHTVAFFWLNLDKQQLVFQGRASDSQNLKNIRKIPLENDIVSRIARTGKPEVVTHISPNSESDLLPYYTDVEFVKSFIGVPVFYMSSGSERSVVGVLAIDSKAEDAFGSETLSLLNQFTKLLAALIKSHTEKYDLLLDSELLSSIRKMNVSIRENPDLRSIIYVLAEQTKRLIGYDYFAVTMFNDDRRNWVVYHVDVAQGGSYVSPHLVVDMNESLIRTVLENNTHLLVEDLSAVTVPRFNNEEKVDSAGSILILPLSSINKCYGTVSIERRERSAYSRRDIEVLYRLSDNTAAALEILYMSEVIDKYVIIDELTGLLKKNHFEQMLKNEIKRADDFGIDLTYAMFSIDHIQSFIGKFGKEGLDSALYSFSRFLEQSVRPYDLSGRLDYNRFGIVLINTAASDGYLWAEKVRKNFAGQVLTIENKTVSVTVSSGVCGLTENMQFAEFTQHTTAALQKAVESDGNIVRVY
jgi:diguanylate cyclase (GGDEF)-like protein